MKSYWYFTIYLVTTVAITFDLTVLLVNSLYHLEFDLVTWVIILFVIVVLSMFMSGILMKDVEKLLNE